MSDIDGVSNIRLGLRFGKSNQLRFEVFPDIRQTFCQRHKLRFIQSHTVAVNKEMSEATISIQFFG